MLTVRFNYIERIMKRFFVIVILLLCFPVVAMAKVTTIRELKDTCEAGERARKERSTNQRDIADALICAASLNNAMNMYQLMFTDAHISKGYCRGPEDWRVGQGIKVFMKWAAENPDKYWEASVTGIVRSHIEAFCIAKK